MENGVFATDYNTQLSDRLRHPIPTDDRSDFLADSMHYLQ